MELLQNIGQGLRTFASDVAQGFFEITHNGFALLGLVVVVCAGTALARPDLRQSAEVFRRLPRPFGTSLQEFQHHMIACDAVDLFWRRLDQ